MKQKFINDVSMIALAIVMLCAVFAISQANAGEREKDHDHQTINDIVRHEHNDLGKGIAIGILATCGLRSLYYGIKESRWTWCGEPKKDMK